ncbi:hypothetical protein ACIQWR_17970, partial [Streptomyces sp. NPDC098789]|uniref:hypothetical protein n=1 Tax=Streptomyces sp. NPDC098789 TaxID=3366098 RepID=UPI0037F8F575
MQKIAVVLTRRRRPPQELWDQVVFALEDQIMVAAAAGNLLSEAGPGVLDGHADRLAAFLRHHRAADAYSPSLIDHILVALTGLDDRRALPLLTARVSVSAAIGTCGMLVGGRAQRRSQLVWRLPPWS